MIDQQPIRVAIIGCGGITQKYHLPSVSSLDQCQVTVLVDRDRNRAHRLADAYHVPNVKTSYHEIMGHADAAIVALPHYLHAPVSIDLLRAGIHILVEKPMAMSSQECNEMIDAAVSSGAVLAVGLLRRFMHSAQRAKQIIADGLLGDIRSFDFREGNVYNWPVASDFFFRREAAGGGVLCDTGAHTLDMLLWWLGDVASFEYLDDNYGGVEADCELHATMGSGAKGIVELSRTRNLRNTAIIRGERGEIEVHLRHNWISFHPLDGTVGVGRNGIVKPRLDKDKQNFRELFLIQLQDWLNAIPTGRPPAVTGREALSSVALIEACYAQRRLLQLPWVQPNTRKE